MNLHLVPLRFIQLTFILQFIFVSPTQAEFCGNELTASDVAQFTSNMEAGFYDSVERTEAQYLCRVAQHIVIPFVGSYGVSQDILDYAMENMNQYFEASGIQYFVSVQDTIYSEELSSIDSPEESTALREMNIVENAVDIYYVETFPGLCGVSSYSWYTENLGIIMVNHCTNDNGILAHEMGHYFDLFHTHERAFGIECPDGSNCETAGDLVCDTPADGNHWQYCVSVSEIDCNGSVQEYAANAGNIMSYADDNCYNHFTPEQNIRALATYINLRPELYLTPGDLLHSDPPDWSSSLVARIAPNGQEGGCIVSPTLTGNISNTWINHSAYNQAIDAAEGYTNRYTLDNQTMFITAVNSHPAGTRTYLLNYGPYFVRGGRHALVANLDDQDQFTELSESNNIYRQQWIWSPLQLGVNSSILESSPPNRMSASFTYPNCVGYQFENDGWWEIVAIQPADFTADYDLRLHNDYSGSTNGFGAYLASSSYGMGQPDWLIINRNLTGSISSWQAGVNNYSNQGGDYRIQRNSSTTHYLVEDGSFSELLPAGKIVDIREIYVGSEDLANEWWFHLSTADAGDLDMVLYDKTLEIGGRSTSVLATSEEQETSNQSFMAQFNQNGYYALVIYKDDWLELDQEFNYTLTMKLAQADLAFQQIGGGQVFLPRPPESECSVPVEPQFPGDVLVDVGVVNIGQQPAAAGWNVRLTFDGPTRTISGDFGSALSPSTTLTWCGLDLGSVRSGRHELGVQLDYYHEVGENFDTNNEAYLQYLWEPLILENGVPQVHPPAPNYLNARNPHALSLPGFNQDGYRANLTFGSNWVGVALVAHGNQDQLNLYTYAGNDNLLNPIGFSTAPAGEVIILAIKNSWPYEKEFGVCNAQSWPDYPGNNNYSIEMNNVSQSAGGINQVNQGLLSSGRIIDSYYTSLTIGEVYLIELQNQSEADLALAVYPPSGGVLSLDDALLILDAGGAGENESGMLTALEQGSYGIMVYKTLYTDLHLEANYTLIGGGSPIQPINDLSITVTDADLSDQFLHFDLNWSAPLMYEDSTIPAIVDHYELYLSLSAYAPFPGPDWFHWDNTTIPQRINAAIWTTMTDQEYFYRVVAVNMAGQAVLSAGVDGFIDLEELHQQTSRVTEFGQPGK
jgi:hypothetical protein